MNPESFESRAMERKIVRQSLHPSPVNLRLAEETEISTLASVLYASMAAEEVEFPAGEEEMLYTFVICADVGDFNMEMSPISQQPAIKQAGTCQQRGSVRNRK